MEKIETFDFTKKPRKPSKFFFKAVRATIVPVWLGGQEITLEKRGLEGIEPPYLLFCTHASQLDYPVLYRILTPHTAHVLCALSGVRDVGEFILSRLGCFYKRTFVNEVLSLRHIRTCIQRDKSVMCIFPESRYSYDGTANSIPGSLGKMAKLMKVPVAVLRMNGNYITDPQWGNTRRHPPIHCEMELIASADEVKELPADELQARIKSGLERDDFAYQKENRIKIDDKTRAEGLHNILYQCPHCGKEFEMYSEGSELYCGACGKRWELTEYGELKAKEGKTEFDRVPDWMNWQRENVKKEVRSGTYFFEDEVEVHTLPHYKKFYYHGRGRLVQTPAGTVLECIAYGEPKKLVWESRLLEGIHIEFDYPAHKKTRKDNRFGDCIELSITDDSYWLSPVSGRTQIMKIALATEEINLYAIERAKDIN